MNLTVADKITYTTGNTNVFIGGDALRGASTAINAIGDGRKVAEQMIRQSDSWIHFQLNILTEKIITKKN